MIIDNRNDNNNHIWDEVNAYNLNQIFNALRSDVRSISAFKTKLLEQNNNRQQTEVNELFKEYNY
ncbi:MAG: hypothetical protein ACOVNR_08430 [Chitinophagaceae bacterium]